MAKDLNLRGEVHINVDIMIILMMICNTNSNDNNTWLVVWGMSLFFHVLGNYHIFQRGWNHQPLVFFQLKHLKLDTCFSIMEIVFFWGKPKLHEKDFHIFRSWILANPSSSLKILIVVRRLLANYQQLSHKERYITYISNMSSMG